MSTGQLILVSCLVGNCPGSYATLQIYIYIWAMCPLFCHLSTLCYFTGIFYAAVRQISMLFIDNKDSVFCILYSVMCNCVRTAVFFVCFLFCFVFLQEVLSGWFFFNGFTDLIMYKFSSRLVTSFYFLRERSWGGGWGEGGTEREAEREREGLIDWLIDCLMV